MKNFFKNIENKIYDAVKKELKSILQETGNEKIYSVALVTDEDCISLFLSVNTYEYLRKQDLKNLEFMKQYLSEEKISRVEQGTDSLTKWTPDEWGYSGGKNSDLVKVSELLFKKEEQNSKEYEENKDLFFETLISALKRIIDDNVMGDTLEEITYYISMSDGDGIEEIENYSAKLLNAQSVYEAFLHRYDEEN